MQIRALLEEELAKHGLDKEVKLVVTGCHGLCEMGPLVIVYPEGTMYVHVQPEDVSEIVSEHLLKGRVVSSFTLQRASYGRTGSALW